MSHFTKCEMKMTNLAAIKRAIEDLELEANTAEENQQVMVRGWKGAETMAEITINMGKYDVGVVKNADGTFDLVADWWGIETTRGVTEEEFKNKLNNRYSYNRVVMACEDKGYAVEEETNEEDGTVQLVMRKWVSD